MKLQRLAGYGPAAAFVSAGSLLLFFVIAQFGLLIAQAVPGIYVPLSIIFMLALWLWVGALAVVVLDLEWLDHPATSTRWFQVARVATLIAVVAPLVLAIAIITNAGVTLQAPSYFLIFCGIGVSLLIHNLDGRRAGLLHGVLPWLGIVTAAFYILVGISYGSFLFTPVLYMTGFYLLQVGQVLYIAWAIWLGVKLSRSKSAATAMVPAPTH